MLSRHFFAPTLMVWSVLPMAARAGDLPFTGAHTEIVADWDQTDIGPNLPARTGFLYGLAAGHDWAAGPVRLGIEGEAAGSTARGQAGGREQAVGRGLYAGVRLGVPMGRRVLLYAKGGYANGRFSGPVNYTGDGWRIGGGGEVATTGKLFLRAEFRYSDYGRVARGQQAVAMVGWRF